MKTNKINRRKNMKAEIGQEYDSKLLLEAVVALIEARPVAQLAHTIDTLFECYTTHNQLVGGAIVRAIEPITAFLRSLKEITTVPGPVNGQFDREFKAVGEKLRALRLAAGQDEETVADTIGIELSHLQRIEQGLCGDMRIGLMSEFADYFYIPVQTLFITVPPEKFTAPDDHGLPPGSPRDMNDGDKDTTNDAAL